MSSADVDKALIQKFVNSELGISAVHENSDFAPVAGTEYAELIVIPNDITPFSLFRTNETDGVFRIILRFPTGELSVRAKEKAEEIMTAFKIGTRLVYGNAKVHVTGQSRQPGVAEEGWFKVVVSIGYRAFIRR